MLHIYTVALGESPRCIQCICTVHTYTSYVYSETPLNQIPLLKCPEWLVLHVRTGETWRQGEKETNLEEMGGTSFIAVLCHMFRDFLHEELTLNSEVSSFQEFLSTQTRHLGPKKVSCLRRYMYPKFRGVLIEDFK